MKNYHIFLFLCAALLQLAPCKPAQADGYVNCYTYKTSSGEIVDLATKLGVNSVGTPGQNDVYIINNQINFCLSFKDKTSGLWNTVTNQITRTPGPHCTLPKNAKMPDGRIYGSIPSIVASPWISQLSPIQFIKDLPICYTVKIPVAGLGGHSCTISVQTYITIAYPDHHTYSFFLVSRLKKPKWVEPCGDYPEKPINTNYLVNDSSVVGIAASPRVVYVEFVNPGNICNISKQPFLKITTNQVDHIVSFQNNNTFLIPLDMVNHQLELAGARRVKRQEIIQNIIDNYIHNQHKQHA